MYDGNDVSDSLEQIQIEFKPQDTLQNRFQNAIMESANENEQVLKASAEDQSDLYFYEDDQFSCKKASKPSFWINH